MPATFSIIGLALNLIGVIVLFRYGMPYRVRTEGDTGSATVTMWSTITLVCLASEPS
jgi:hypothetical protein